MVESLEEAVVFEVPEFAQPFRGWAVTEGQNIKIAVETAFYAEGNVEIEAGGWLLRI